MAVLNDLAATMAAGHLERSGGIGKTLDILKPDETVLEAALSATVRGPTMKEIERLFGAFNVGTDVVFEVATQGTFTLSGVEPHLIKVRYPATDGLIHEIVQVEADDADPGGIATVAVLFGKTPARGVGEIPL